MQLTSLTLHGFKSFGERTTIEFAPGITGVVGPNGSGKSNVIDALRWATGGGRASEFRAGDKTDLIFHGAAGKRSVGYAEVALELVHNRRSTRIARSIYRDGSLKLTLNGQNARLLDIDEELAGTGLGRGSLAVIGQGEVGQVLTADPEKLLSYVAEAAGISRLSTRRDQAQSRLDTAQQHLLRLEDIMGQLSRQVEALRAEAEQAQRHDELTAEALRLRYTQSVLRVQGLADDVKKYLEQQVQLSEQLDVSRDKLRDLRAQWQALRESLGTLEADYRQALTEAEAKRGDVRVAEERVQALGEQQSGLSRELGTLEAEISRLEALEAPQQPQEDLATLEQQVAEKQTLYKDAQREVTTLEAELASKQKALDEVRQAATAAQQASIKYLSQKEQLESQLSLLEARLGETSASVDLQPVQVEVAELERNFKTLEGSLDSARAELNTAMQQHAESEAEAGAQRRAAARARSAFEARQGYAQGPRLALGSGLAGIYGSVADLVRVPEAYRQAVAAALGRRAEYIVVDTAATAQRVIAYVKKAGGWVTVLPLELIRASRATLSSRIAAYSGVIAQAVDVVETEPRFAPIVNQLLGSTVLIETMDQAVQLARKENSRPRLVTLDGNSLEAYGAMTGGQSRVNATVLGAASEVEEAESAADAATSAAQRAKEAVLDLQTRTRELQHRFQDLRSTLEAKQQALSQLRQDSQVALSRRDELSKQYENIAASLAALVRPEADPDLPSLERENEVLNQLIDDLRQRRAQLDVATDVYRGLDQHFALAKERKQRFEFDLSRYTTERERLKSLFGKRDDLHRLEGVSQHQLQQANDALASALAALPKDLSEKQSRFETAGQQARATEQQLGELTETQAALSEQLETVKVTLARRESALELAEEDLGAFPEGLVAFDLSSRACRERLNTVEEELELIGPVNHRATAELAEQRARLEDLEVQTVQAALAVAELEAALERIDKETTQRLEAATTSMRTHFKAYVTKLFGGDALGDIKVHYDEERPTGLSIQLQPPGKRTTSLNLLSVGERTMGAMAFLFSLIQGEDGKGLPLAILDEVDAPLDEANIRRYNAFVQHLAQQGTQFILITHQKATFDIADVLWGVTSDRGVSRVFSISKAQYAAVG